MTIKITSSILHVDVRFRDFSIILLFNKKCYIIKNKIGFSTCTDSCLYPKNKGKFCFARQHRWYFNRNTRSCKQFVYLGCHGNRNNFKTQLECNSRCEKYIYRNDNNVAVDIPDRINHGGNQPHGRGTVARNHAGIQDILMRIY